MMFFYCLKDNILKISLSGLPVTTSVRKGDKLFKSESPNNDKETF